MNAVGVQLARDSVDAATVLRNPGRAAERPDVRAAHVVVGIVGAEREHDNVRVKLPRHLLDAREPVVEVGARKAGRQPALDADDVESAADPLERVTRDLRQRIACDPDAQRVRSGEERLHLLASASASVCATQAASWPAVAD